MKKIMLVIALVAATFVAIGAAQATGDDPCTVRVVDVPEHQVKVIDTPAQDAVPGQWWNWSPNKDQGPFDGPPAFPTDERGTWQGPHTEGGPDGEGTYQMGNGNGSWFHREPGTPAVEEVSHMETIPATYKDVEVPCETPPTTDEPVVTPPKVNPPKVTPPVDKPKVPTVAPKAGALPNTGA